MGLQQQVTIDQRVVAAVDQVADEHAAAGRFGDLRSPEVDELAVQPPPDPRSAVAEVGLALRDLVGVVHGYVVDAAGVDIEVRTQVLDRHHRALQVPARRAAAPR